MSVCRADPSCTTARPYATLSMTKDQGCSLSPPGSTPIRAASEKNLNQKGCLPNGRQGRSFPLNATMAKINIANIKPFHVTTALPPFQGVSRPVRRSMSDGSKLCRTIGEKVRTPISSRPKGSFLSFSPSCCLRRATPAVLAQLLHRGD